MSEMYKETTKLQFRKSSYSGSGSGNCIEVASAVSSMIAVRDSKDTTGPVLRFAGPDFGRFIQAVKNQEF